MDGICSTGRERRGSYRVLVGKPEGKRLLGRHGHTCVCIKKGSPRYCSVGGREKCVDSIDLTQAKDRWRALVTEMMNLGAP